MALPEKFKDSHDYCFYLHDILVTFLKSGEEVGIFKGEFEIKFNTPEETDAFMKLKGVETWEWMEKNGYLADTLIYAYQHTAQALLSDMCHFIYEGLKCAEKGKLTVAFALLRKPLQQNLLFLEWMLARPSEFSMIFKEKSADEIEKFLINERRKIIEEASKKTKGSESLGMPLLYDSRFKRDASNSFCPLWDMANHLVTNNKHYKTEKQNLNFIFSDNAARETQWNFLYSHLPYVLFYAIEVVESLLSHFAKGDETVLFSMQLQRVAGLMLWQHKFFENGMPEDKAVFIKDWDCPFCSSKVIFDITDIEMLYANGVLLCSKCLEVMWPIDIDDLKKHMQT